MIDIAYPALVQTGEQAWEIGPASPSVESGYIWHYWIPSFALLNRHKFRLCRLQDKLADGTRFIYPLELRWEFIEWFARGVATQFLTPNLPELVIDSLRAGRARLLLFFGHEARTFGMTCSRQPEIESVYDLIHDFVRRHDLPAKAVWFVHGDLSGEAEYTAWRKRRNIEGAVPFEVRAVEPYSWMTQAGRRTHEEGLALDVQWDIDEARAGFANIHKCLHISLKPHGRALPEIYADLPDPSGAKDPSKLFLCMNRVTRQHRRLIVCFMEVFGALDRSLVSFRDDTPDQTLFEDPDLQAAWERVQAKQPLTIDRDLPLDAVTYMRDNFATVSAGEAWPYREAALSVVNETHFDVPMTFVSEKIWKPIVHGHPFVVVGTPGSLAYLHELGFKTFAPFLNEGYDDLREHSERMRHLFALLRSVANLQPEHLSLMREKLAPITAFNAHHMRTFTTPMERVMEEIVA